MSVHTPRTASAGVASPAVCAAHLALLVVSALVGVTAVAGGVSLVIGALVPEYATILTPPVEYLDGSPFPSFLVPGIVLTVVVGGTHLWAFGALLRRTRHRYLIATVAGFGVLVWIFVQMTVIPFSFLQAAYVVAGLAEIGFVLVVLGLFDDPVETLPPSRIRRTIGR